MKFFILGHNPELSVAEIFSYFEKCGIKYGKWEVDENVLIVDAEFDSGIIQEFGGTLAIGRLLASGNKSKILDSIAKSEIYFGEEVKFSYSLTSEDDEILDAIKNKFRGEKLKARYQKNNADIVYFSNDKHFGVAEAVYDSKQDEFRDMKKPVRREGLAIPPRLARILVNLSQVNKKIGILMDPFCGIGVILQEALLQGINVTGVDSDKIAISNAKQNIRWLEKNYKIQASYGLINGDSRKIRLREISGIATEPPLGKMLRKVQSREQAEFMAKKCETLIISILQNMGRYLKFRGKIAFTMPLIRIQNGRIGCDIERICKATRLQVYNLPGIKFPISEFREGQLVGRQIMVLVRE